MPRITAILIALALAAPAAIAAEKFDPQARAAAIAWFVDEETFAVIRVDLTRVDVDAIWDKLAEVFPVTGERDVRQSAEEKKMIQPWLADMIKAGGRELFLVVGTSGPILELAFAVVPLTEGADARAIAGLLYSGRADGPTSRPSGSRGWRKGSSPLGDIVRMAGRVGDYIVGGAPGQLERLRARKAFQPVSRPELAQAFAAAGDTTAQFLLIPTADSRKVVEEMMPTLPEEVGGGPSTAVTRGLMWAAVGVDLPPKMSAKLVIQSQDAASARALKGVIAHGYTTIEKLPAVRQFFPEVGKLTAMLTPTVQGDRLTLALGEKDLNALISDVLAPPIRRAREQARRAMSAVNVRAIAKAICMYAADHNGRPPEGLQVLAESKMIDARTLTNPARPEMKVGYVYLKPPLPLDKLPEVYKVILVYEAHDAWKGGINVGFADGHVELVRDEGRFKELLAKSKAVKAKED